jgi:hypothetical protein
LSGIESAPDRTTSIETLEAGHQQIKELVDGLDASSMTRERTIGGGDWSVKDLLAHITTWEELALQAMEAWRGGSPEPLRAELREKGIDAFNAERVALKSKMPLAHVLTQFDSVHGELIERIRTMPGWDRVPPGRRTRTCGYAIGSITGGPGGGFKHAWAHLGDLRAYVESPR